MVVTILVPCFVDQFCPEVGLAMAQVLARLDHEVEFRDSVICCGQPPFNAGYWDEARTVAERALAAYESCEAIVVASGSCAAMLKVSYPELFRGTPLEPAARSLAERTWEFSQFLVDRLGVTDVGARFAGQVTVHDGCHSLRAMGIQQQPRALLRQVRDLELVEMDEAASCCGFGGVFSVKFPLISTAMGEVELASCARTGAGCLVSADPSCLLHLRGLMAHRHQPIRCLHLAEILANR